MCKARIADPFGLVTNPKTSWWADPLGLTKTKWGDPAGIFKSEHEKQARLEAEKNKLPEDKKKPVAFLANPWLDGLGIAGVNARGRNSLRIDPGTPRVPVNIPAAALPVASPIAPPVAVPSNGLGIRGGGSSGSPLRRAPQGSVRRQLQ